MIRNSWFRCRAAHHLNGRMCRAVLTCGLVAGLWATSTLHAQRPYDWHDRYDRNGRYDAYSPLAEIDAGTYVPVRTVRTIDANRADGRIFPAVVDEDVWDDARRLAVPAIPRGSAAELSVRTARDGDLVLDLESVTVNGHRYAIAATANRVESQPRGDKGDRAATYVGGGAILGTIIGAIAGGGKGAAIGAAAGAGAGAAGLITTSGRTVRVPAESVVTFQLERSLAINVPARGYDRREGNPRR